MLTSELVVMKSADGTNIVITLGENPIFVDRQPIMNGKGLFSRFPVKKKRRRGVAQ